MIRVPALRAKLAVTAGARRENVLEKFGQRFGPGVARGTRTRTYFSHPGASTFIIGSALNTVSILLHRPMAECKGVQRNVPVLWRASVSVG